MSMTHHQRRAALAALAAVAALTAGCASSGGTPKHASTSATHSATAHVAAARFPVTVRTAAGSVTIARQPTAIVSLSPTATEMLFAIGAGSQVKAVDQDSDYPANAPHTTLNAFQLDPEAVAGYHPDLVVASNLTPAQQKQLATLHIPVLDEPAATDLAGTYAQLTQLGVATGHTGGAAAEVASMKRQIAAIVAAAPKPARPLTYYYELDQTYYSVTSTTFVGQLLKLLGLTSIADTAKGAAAAGGYPQLSAEFVLKANPDYVLLADTRCCKQSAATVAKRPGWSTLAAVRAGRVVPLDDDIASRWGPRVVDLLRTVAAALRAHPVTS
jgi:iron complex transport system substrate-binding protein